MAVRAATLIRASMVVGAALVAAAGLIRPFERTVPARRTRPLAVPPAVPVVPVAPPARVTPSGLLGVGAATLLARVRQSGAPGASAPGAGARGAKGVLVNAWASWCGSCKGDIPLLLGLPKTFGSNIEVLFVSVDEPESQPAAIEMLLSLHVPLPSYVVDEPLDVFKAGINPRWPGMLPATFLFDGTGKLRYHWGGPVLEPDVVPLLRRYLAGEHIDGEANFALSAGAVTR